MHLFLYFGLFLSNVPASVFFQFSKAFLIIKKNNKRKQSLVYEACDGTCIPPHKPKTSERRYIMHILYYENVFEMCMTY